MGQLWEDNQENRDEYRRKRYGEIARVENIGLNRNAILETRNDGMIALVQEIVTQTDPGVTVPPQYRDLIKTTPHGMMELAEFFNRQDVYETLERMCGEWDRRVHEQQREREREQQAHGKANHTRY